MLDYVIISHFDQDHVGGILSVLKEMEVKKVIIGEQGEECEQYQSFRDIVKQRKISVVVVKKGDIIKLEKDIKIRILFPDNDLITENILNNNSLVFRLEYKGFDMLFTGDIEAVAEKKILKEVESRLLKADLLKIAHHGSKSSSIEQFIEIVEPKIALIGVGENNKFGHPNSSVLERLDKLRNKSV